MYLFVYDGKRALPTRVASRYNEAEDRYERPTRELVEELAKVIDVDVVEDPTDYRVRYDRGSVPDGVRDRAVFVEERRASELVLLPTAESVQKAIDTGGRPVD